MGPKAEEMQASSSGLGLLRCPNATSLGWGSRAVTGNRNSSDDDVAAVAVGSKKHPEGVNIEDRITSSVSPMVEKFDASVADSVTNVAASTSLKPVLLDSSSTTKYYKTLPVTGSSASEGGNTEVNERNVRKASRKRSWTSVSGALFHHSDNVTKNSSLPNDVRGDESANTTTYDDDDDDDDAVATDSPTTHGSGNCISVVLDYEQGVDGDSEKVLGSQILTVTYHTRQDGTDHETSSTTVIGTISGRAKIELLPPFPETHGIEMGQSDSCSAHTHNSVLTLDILGYRVSSQQQLACSNNTIVINRPNWMNSLPISVIFCHSCHAERLTPSPVVRVRIQPVSDNMTEHNEHASDDDETCGYYTAYPKQSYEIQILPSSAIFPGNYTAAGSGVCTVLATWEDTLDKIINRTTGESATGVDKSNKNTPYRMDNRILICGAKGVGKSNLLRYSTNRLLSTLASQSDTNLDKRFVPRVAILDLDCGQAELSPPGLLSLTIVSKPLLSDPPIHMVCGGSCNHNGQKLDCESNNDDEFPAKHEAAYFFGDVSSKADPDAYIQMTSQLMRRYCKIIRELGGDIPLLVNTDGWVKGLGYEILCGIIGVINPGNIVQIMGNTKAKSFDMSAHDQYGNVASNDQCRHKSRIIYVLQSFDESVFSTQSGNDESRRSSFDKCTSGKVLANASDHRVHRMCAYFLGGYDRMIKERSIIAGRDVGISFSKEKGVLDPDNLIGLTLSSMPPYAVPFDFVRIYPPPGLIDGIAELRSYWGLLGNATSTDVLDSLNGSIVGLCFTPDEIDIPFSRCNAGTGVPILNCVGLGIIRSIDYLRKLFFVLTPVHPRLLTSVTIFVGGQINLPLECLYRGVHSDSFPFMTCYHSIASSTVGKKR